MRKYKFTLLFLFILPWLAMSFTHHQANSADAQGLPTRPPTVTPQPPAGGLIILQVEATLPVLDGLWTVVQWQDANGDWHDVEGWQGNFNEKLEVIWWVAPEDLGKGPFHWLITERQGSTIAVTNSKPFFLPAKNRSIVNVEVMLP